jgi:hypothetical protein
MVNEGRFFYFLWEKKTNLQIATKAKKSCKINSLFEDKQK